MRVPKCENALFSYGKALPIAAPVLLICAAVVAGMIYDRMGKDDTQS
jgi:hypothetical protein